MLGEAFVKYKEAKKQAPAWRETHLDKLDQAKADKNNSTQKKERKKAAQRDQTATETFSKNQKPSTEDAQLGDKTLFHRKRNTYGMHDQRNYGTRLHYRE
jgi:hypothetical protein